MVCLPRLHILLRICVSVPLYFRIINKTSSVQQRDTRSEIFSKRVSDCLFSILSYGLLRCKASRSGIGPSVMGGYCFALIRVGAYRVTSYSGT